MRGLMARLIQKTLKGYLLFFESRTAVGQSVEQWLQTSCPCAMKREDGVMRGTVCSWRAGSETAKRSKQAMGRREAWKRTEPALKSAWALQDKHYSRHIWSPDPVLICNRKPQKAAIPLYLPSNPLQMKADTLQMGKKKKKEASR